MSSYVPKCYVATVESVQAATNPSETDVAPMRYV